MFQLFITTNKSDCVLIKIDFTQNTYDHQMKLQNNYNYKPYSQQIYNIIYNTAH